MTRIIIIIIMSAEIKIFNGIIRAVGLYKISHVFWDGGKGDEILPKVFAKSFANILAKFHELRISTKPQHYFCLTRFV